MRLIDADALIQDIREHSASYFADDFAHEWVDRQPTIEPQRTGKWMRQNPMVDTEECSECGWNILSNEMETPYCPNYGAKMEDTP